MQWDWFCSVYIIIKKWFIFKNLMRLDWEFHIASIAFGKDMLDINLNTTGETFGWLPSCHYMLVGDWGMVGLLWDSLKFFLVFWNCLVGVASDEYWDYDFVEFSDLFGSIYCYHNSVFWFFNLRSVYDKNDILQYFYCSSCVDYIIYEYHNVQPIPTSDTCTHRRIFFGGGA